MRISDWSSDVCSSDLGRARIVAQTHIGGGKADGAAQLVAMADLALDGEGPRQKPGGGRNVARLQRRAEAGGGNHAAAIGQRGHGLRFDPITGAKPVEKGDVAAPVVAEGKIMARHPAAKPKPTT